jgi:hypothetical protein
MINKGEQQSAFIAGGSSGDFYQIQGISVTPLMPVALGASSRGMLKRGSPEAPSSTRDRSWTANRHSPIKREIFEMRISLLSSISKGTARD